MNKVAERCKKQGCAKFLFTANRMFTELKYIKLALYALNIVPVVICFLPQSDDLIKLICSCVAFGLTLINMVASALLGNYKEKAIMEHQLYEAAITGSSFSKVEYDRECTNDLHELAIRKGLPTMKKYKTYPVSYVPDEVNDDYSYLYLCRISAAKTRFLLSRIFYAYVLSLIVIAVVLISVNFSVVAGQAIYTLVCCWSLITPILSNCTASKKCIRQCSKICADIDNFFADGDCSVERLARFYYYVQNIEFEMMLTRPVIYKFVQLIFRRGTNALSDGVTQRFLEAIVELKQRNLMLKGVIAQPHGKSLITSKDYDLEYLMKKEQAKKKKLAKAKKLKQQEKENRDAAAVSEAAPQPVAAKPAAPQPAAPKQQKAEPKKTEVKKPEPPKKTEPVKKAEPPKKAEPAKKPADSKAKPKK